ncbi:hypothetical protein GCM10020000_30610 [Streptomyces olivoverticillatus]
MRSERGIVARQSGLGAFPCGNDAAMGRIAAAAAQPSGDRAGLGRVPGHTKAGWQVPPTA